MNTKSTSERKRLAVIPSDPLEAYKSAGYSNWLQDYYNPLNFFKEVYLLSPLEKEERSEFGMGIIPTKPEELRSRIRELSIDAVRAYGGYWPCDMACNHKVDGVPTIVSVHDKRWELLSDSIKRADFVFCVSETVRQLVLRKFEELNKTWILPNRVDFNVMSPFEGKLDDLNNNYPYKYRIFHVGRKSKEKNLDSLIKALKILGSEYCLIATGKGDRNECVALAEEQGVRKRCDFVESINNESLARYYSWADCLCVPSRAEGFGIVFIEALACGAVVVTSDIAPMNEYIHHMENGFLVKDFENPTAIADAVKKACEDESIRRVLKANARQSVRKFEKSRVDALEVEYYKRVLEMNRKGYCSTPLFQKLTWSLEDHLRKFVPTYIKKKIRLRIYR